MINGFYRNDLSEYKKFSAFHLFVARGIRTYAYPVVFFIAAVVFCVFGALSQNSLLYIGAAMLFAVSLALPFVTLALQNAKIEKRVRTNSRFMKTQQFFSFGDESLHLKIKAGEEEEEYDIPYAQIPRIYERQRVFYIYIGVSQALILPKSGIEDGKTDELALLFRQIGKRFREKKKLRSTGGVAAGE